MNCFECGSAATVSHHVVPKSKGGTRTVPMCGYCHGLAHHARRNMTTSALTKTALQKRKAAGLRIGGVPYGWNVVDGNRLAPVSKEQQVLGLILSMRASGISLRGIADFLTDWGVVTKCGHHKWSHSTIQRIVSDGR